MKKVEDFLTCDLVIPLLKKEGVGFIALVEDLEFDNCLFNKIGHLEVEIKGKFLVTTEEGMNETAVKAIDKMMEGVNKKNDKSQTE